MWLWERSHRRCKILNFWQPAGNGMESLLAHSKSCFHANHGCSSQRVHTVNMTDLQIVHRYVNLIIHAILLRIRSVEAEEGGGERWYHLLNGSQETHRPNMVLVSDIVKARTACRRGVHLLDQGGYIFFLNKKKMTRSKGRDIKSMRTFMLW